MTIGKSAVTAGSDRAYRMEVMIGLLLRIGVACSVTFITTGFVWRWLATGTFAFDYSIEGMNFFEFLLGDVRQLVNSEVRPRLLVNLGIGVLLMTPYLRVLASLAYFASVERDLKYTAFTAFVLAVLTYSLLSG